MLRSITKFFEHRLFLTATPHNGYTQSFSGLLELLDPVRFQQKIVFAKSKERVGEKLTCLVDSVDENGAGTGRYYGQAPHIDSVCLIKNCSQKPGRFVKVKIIGTKGYDFIVREI